MAIPVNSADGASHEPEPRDTLRDDWRVIAMSLGLERAVADFPDDVEAAFLRAQMLRRRAWAGGLGEPSA